MMGSQGNDRAARPRRWPGIALVALLGAAGCADRTHITPTYGRSYRAAFARQVKDPEAARHPRPLLGLDSQEAAILLKSYHESLARKGESAPDQPVLLLPSPKQRRTPWEALPPPSVPPEDR